MSGKAAAIVQSGSVAVKGTKKPFAEIRNVTIWEILVIDGTNGPHIAVMTFEKDKDGEKKTHARSSETGPIDAIFNAINFLVEVNAELRSFHVDSPGDGAGAVATVRVTLSLGIHGGEGSGKGDNTNRDTLFASAKAYIKALVDLQNNIDKRASKIPEELPKTEPVYRPSER